MPNLEIVWLFRNKFSGELFEDMSGAASTLVVFDVYQNELSGELPASWGSTLTAIQQMIFGRNQFSGPLPEEWQALTNLTVLNVEENQLTGPVIPEAYRDWSGNGIKQLRLSNNDFDQGEEIPRFVLEEWTDLEDVRFGNLGMTGRLRGLENWSNLRILDLEGNDFEGGFPKELANLENLVAIDLSDNPNLGGSLPDSVENWGSLHTLDIHTTNMTGSWSEDITSLPSLGT